MGSCLRRSMRTRVCFASNLGRGWLSVALRSPTRDSAWIVRPLLGLVAATAVIFGVGLQLSASAFAKSCNPVVNPYKGSRYEGINLSSIHADGLPCDSARKVARRAHKKALKKVPDLDGTLDFHWRKWDVSGNLIPAHDRYVAKRGPDRVRWRF